MNTGVEAIHKLKAMGYRPHLEGENIRLLYEGPGTPDPGIVKPLVAQVREFKSQVIEYLAPKPQDPERILTCFECDHFRPAMGSPNPRDAWGLCRKRNKGRFAAAMACEAVFLPLMGSR